MFSELHQVEPEVFKAQVGLDEADFVDQDVQEVVGVFDEVKLGLEDDGQEDGESEDDEESDEDDMLENEEEQGEEEPSEDPVAN